MKNVPLSLLVVLGLIFLPSCSNSEVKACEAAINSVREYELSYNPKFVMIERLKRNQEQFTREKIWERIEAERKGLKLPENNAGLEVIKLREQAESELYKSQLVIVNNPNCFTPEQVVEAQIATNND